MHNNNCVHANHAQCDKELQAHYGWQQGDTAYESYSNGMLKSVRTPEGATIRFEYDALGRHS